MSRDWSEFELRVCTCSCDPESESQNLGNPNRSGELGDFHCNFLKVSQITETDCNGRPLWPVGLSGFQNWERIRRGERGSRLSIENEAPGLRTDHDLSRLLLRQCGTWFARSPGGMAEK